MDTKDVIIGRLGPTLAREVTQVVSTSEPKILPNNNDGAVNRGSSYMAVVATAASMAKKWEFNVNQDTTSEAPSDDVLFSEKVHPISVPAQHQNAGVFHGIVQHGITHPSDVGTRVPSMEQNGVGTSGSPPSPSPDTTPCVSITLSCASMEEAREIMSFAIDIRRKLERAARAPAVAYYTPAVAMTPTIPHHNAIAPYGTYQWSPGMGSPPRRPFAQSVYGESN